MKKQFLLLTVLLFLLGACAPKPAEHSFIKVNADGQFVRDGKPYYFVGTNFWYGAILGSEGEGGNRERLHKELDFLKVLASTTCAYWWVLTVKWHKDAGRALFTSGTGRL